MSDNTWVETLDIKEQEHRHRMEENQANNDARVAVERQRTKQARWESFQVIGGAIVAGLVVVAIAFFIYKASTRPGGPPKPPSEEERRETQCITDGGGWVPKDLLDNNADHGLCVFPAKVASAP